MESLVEPKQADNDGDESSLMMMMLLGADDNDHGSLLPAIAGRCQFHLNHGAGWNKCRGIGGGDVFL